MSQRTYEKGDSPILQFGELIFNMMVLNVLWLICSLPIVTIGASTSALYYTFIKLRRNEGESIIRMFFHSFAMNIRQAVILGTGMIAILIILVGGLLQALQSTVQGSIVGVVAMVLLIIVIFLWIVEFSYLFMTVARFDNKIGRQIINSIYFIVKNPKMALKVFFIVFMCMLAIPYLLWTYFPYGVPACIFFGSPLTAYLLAGEFNKLFSDYVPE